MSKRTAKLPDWPIGTAVILTKDDSSEVCTKTRSAPWILGGHTPVIMVEGIGGGYSLSRIRLDKRGK